MGWNDMLHKMEGGGFCSAQTAIKRILNPNFEAQRHQQVDTLV